MITSKNWRTLPISPTCEVLNGKDENGNWKFCELATDKAYPASGKGWMSLCVKHGLKHSEAIPVEQLILSGETFS